MSSNAVKLDLNSHSNDSTLKHSTPHNSIGYNPSLGTNDTKKQVPRWLPISLIALTTVALVVPVVLLRRQRAAALDKMLANTPPPRRTSGVTPAPKAVISQPTPPRTSAAHPPIPPFQSETPDVGDGFNGALYCAKAFGIATLLVSIGASSIVLGIKTAMGVRDTKEFADRMRLLIVTKMAFLSSRIHRPPGPEDEHIEGNATSVTPRSPSLRSAAGARGVEWSWPDAEQRLKAAFERDGFMGWAEAALRELEAEHEAERAKIRRLQSQA
ncbi:hypothetical protein AcV5_000061 [Taiwanofungus camphoratus]|nr:hypothetical protein AcV5_000061 [Antrodia cinnamomea]KAI0945107.1 hypothetical protein AcV7_001737 [Antrodia cinnamomea]